MRITTINTVELSSICDNNCEYCCAPLQHNYRDTGFMEWGTYKKAIDWVLHYARQGTQRELNLMGVGESTLHPDLVEMVHYAYVHLPFRQIIHISTNGNKLTMDMAKGLKKAGISRMHVTGHNPRAIARALRILQDVDIPAGYSVDFMIRPNNWAGQVDWFESRETYPCPWLHNGQAAIFSNGDITRCCTDAFAKGVIGTVDDDLAQLSIEPFELCRTCHQTIPQTERLYRIA